MSEITKGPWVHGWFAGESVDPEKQQWAIGISLDDGCAMGCRGDDYMLVSGICKEADARLMAASKDLLEALILAEDMLCKQENQMRSSGMYEPCPEVAILTARAAINKALGK